DALVGRVDIVAHGGPNSLHLVGADRGADARAADHEAALRLARGDGDCNLARNIGEIDRSGIEAADIQHLVPALLQEGQHLRLHRKARMVRAYDNLHVVFLPFVCRWLCRQREALRLSRSPTRARLRYSSPISKCLRSAASARSGSRPTTASKMRRW